MKIYKIDELLSNRSFLNENLKKNYCLQIYIFIIILIFFLSYSFFFSIELKITGSGILEYVDGITYIRNNVEGKLVYKNMKSGQKVKKGELILRIDDIIIKNEISKLKKEMESIDNFINFLREDEYILDNQIEQYIIEEAKYNLYLKELEIQDKNLEEEKYLLNYLLEVGGVAKNKILEKEKELKIKKIDIEKLYLDKKNMKIKKLKSLIDKKEELAFKLFKAEEEQKKYEIYSNLNGEMEINNNYNLGEYLPINTEIGKIFPGNNKYQVRIFINENDINKIKKDNIINYYIKNEIGEDFFLFGNIKYISKNPTFIEGRKYYVVIGSIDGYKGEEVGIYVENSIVYGRKKIIEYLKELME